MRGLNLVVDFEPATELICARIPGDELIIIEQPWIGRLRVHCHHFAGDAAPSGLRNNVVGERIPDDAARGVFPCGGRVVDSTRPGRDPLAEVSLLHFGGWYRSQARRARRAQEKLVPGEEEESPVLAVINLGN